MATNLQIANDLLTEALLVGGLKTKRETVETALQEFVNRRRQIEVLKLAGTVDYQNDYDYKKERFR